MAKSNKKQSTKTTPVAKAPTVEPSKTPTVEPVIEPSKTPTVEPVIEPATTPVVQPEIVEEEEEVTELEESGMWWYVPSKI
jgi:cell division protein FtsN